jgi:DNA-binding MarR family transcriptional regulator
VTPSPPDRTTNIVGALVLTVADAVRAAAEAAAQHTDAAPAAITSLLAAPAGRSIDQLRQVVGLTPSGGVRLVDRLVADGLAERRRGTDRRTVVVVLTPRGRRTARAILTARARAVERTLSVLDDDERAVFGDLVERLVAGAARRRYADRVAGEPPSTGWMCRLCDMVACGRDDGSCPAAAAATDAAGGSPERAD